MIDAQITQATCEVKCGDETGTGWLVTSSRVITARHCVHDAISATAQISLRFNLADGVHEVSANIVAEDEAFDVCVLQLKQEMDLEPILLDETSPIEGSLFTAFGFPVTKLTIGHRLEGSISQVLDAPQLGMDLDLHIDAPSTLTNYQGLSGAPLICDGQCRGMVRLAIDNALGAISIAKMATFLREHFIPIHAHTDSVFIDPALASREDFTKDFETLLKTLAEGYAFIEGAHGIGKSTFCRAYRPIDPVFEHFATYSFTSHNALTNAMHLAQPEVFFNWLNTLVSTYLTGKAGRVSEKRYAQLIIDVAQLFAELGKAYSSRGKIGVIFVDGLDEVEKLGGGTLERLIGMLPPRMPTGVLLIFSAPSYANISAALGKRIERYSCIAMPSLTPNATRDFCISALSPERASATTVRIICDRAQGHPLYLRYLIDLANGSADDHHLASLPLIEGSIRKYYETLWPQLQGNSDAVNLLAIIARLRQGISIQQLVDILREAEQKVLITTLARIQHLLLHRDETTIYHTSFADFLIEKTALRDSDVQRQIFQYCAIHPQTHYGTLNIVYHGLRAGVEEEAHAIIMCAQDWADRCVMLGAEPDALLGDVDDALTAATRQGRLTEVVQILLLAQRLQFRYDTLFAQSAKLTANGLLCLGKAQEALQHAVRYGRLIVPVPDALRLAFQLIMADETVVALDILDKAEAVLERQMATKNMPISDFIFLHELRVQHLLLRNCAGDEGSMHLLINLHGQSIRVLRDSIADENARKHCLSEVSGYFSASVACLLARYIPLSAIRKNFSGPSAELTQPLISLLANYHVYCLHFDMLPDRSLLDIIFTDLLEIFEEIGDEWEKPSLNVVDTIVTLGAPITLVHALANGRFEKPYPLQFIAVDKINIDERLFTTGMAHWRIASLLDKDLPCPDLMQTHPTVWIENICRIFQTLAWCDGAARRAKDCGDEAELQSVWYLLVQRVFVPLRFTLAERVEWEDCYALPEAIIPLAYERLVNLIVDIFPDRLGYMLSVIENQFTDQCGLYSEGFRRILEKTLNIVSQLDLDAETEDQAFSLLQHWRSFVQENIKNRYELTPALLTLIPLYTRFQASEEAQRIYQAVLAVSMGPSWYKEDQLSLMTTALECIPQGERLEQGILSRVAGLLDTASGEMTFQRFVRYNKADLISILSQHDDYHNAVKYFWRQTCGTTEQLFAEASEGNIDRISLLKGTRYPGDALDEQEAVHRLLKSAIPTAHWPLCWTILEIYQYGDRRHLDQSATAYARLITQEQTENNSLPIMHHRLKLICESDIEADQRIEFLSSLRDKLPLDLQAALDEILGDISDPPSLGTTYEMAKKTPISRMEGEELKNQTSDDDSIHDKFVMPGMFGTPESIQESNEALSRAERELARGNTTAAHMEAQSALQHLQNGGWSIWGGSLSPEATRAEDILLHEARSADSVVKLYAPLILNERHVEKWRRANHLIERIAGIATREERVTLVRLAIEHVEIMVGDSSVKTREYEFLEDTPTLDATSSLIYFLKRAADHPQWLRRDKAAEMILWLIKSFPQYISTIGPTAFSMDSGNFPDILCGALDHISTTGAVRLWDQLASVPDFEQIQHNCKHVGRLAVLLRIAERATRGGSISATAALENLRSIIPQPATANVDSAITQCPAWATIAKDVWHELSAMGLTTQDYADQATAIIVNSCTPLSVETSMELEQVLAEGFRDNSEHPLGRWMAKVRYALQVSLLPFVSEALLQRLEKIFRPYNPTQIDKLRIVGFSSPAKDWLPVAMQSSGAIQPEDEEKIYLDFLENIWINDRYRIFRITAFIHSSRERQPSPPQFSMFPSTELPSSQVANRSESCVVVRLRPAFFGSFTPAVVSATLMQMTGATGADLMHAYWRNGRVSLSRGAGPSHEGCYLAIKREALKLPAGVKISWLYQVDGIPLGTVTRSF